MKKLLLFFAAVMVAGSMWATEQTWSVSSFSGSISNGATTINGATWTMTASTVGSNTKGAPAWSISSNKWKFGNSKDQFWSSYTISTDYFNAYKVTKVVISAYDNGGATSAVSATQGEISIGSASIAQTSTAKTVTLNAASGNGGALEITYTSDKQASYITAITVYYEDDAETVNVTGVSLNQTTAEVLETKKITLVATVAPANATNQNVAWSSNNEEVATVTNGVVKGISAGTATITVTTEDGNLTASCVVTVNEKTAPAGAVFYESFDNFNGAGGNDGQWSGNLSMEDWGTNATDNNGWTTEGLIQEASECASIRKSTASTGGTNISSGLTSPAIGVAGNGHIQFDAEAWGTDTKDFYVQIVDGGTFVESSAIVSLTDNATVAKVELAKSQAEFTTYDLSFTGLTATSKFRFYMAAGKRGFLDEVAVFVTPLATAEVTLSDAGYATYSSAYPFSVEGADAYKAEVSGMNVTFTKITGNIPAGEGVLLGGEASATVTITEATAAAAIEGNDMKATTTAEESCVAKPATGTVYVLNASANEFQKYIGSAFAANKAYLHVEEAAAPAVLHITFAEDEVTAVENVETADAVKFIENGQVLIKKNGVVYNVMGQIVK